MIVRLLLVLVFFLGAGLHVGATASASEAPTPSGETIQSHSTMLPTLRPSVVVEADLVTLGDLFDFAGLHAETPVFRAPPPGTRGTVDIASVTRAAERAGLGAFDLGVFRHVQIERPGTLVSATDLEALILSELDAFRQLRFGPGAGSYKVSFADAPQSHMVAREKASDLQVDLIEPPSERTGLFVASIRTRHGQEIDRLSGTAHHIVRTPVLGRPIGRGEVIRAGDLQMIELAYARAIATPTLTVGEDIIGKAAARSLRAGAPLAPNDVAEPLVVKRQDLVSLTYRQGALALTVRARALDEGALGQAIDVVNLQSNRTVRGVVTGTGLVQVLPPIQLLANSTEGTVQ